MLITISKVNSQTIFWPRQTQIGIKNVDSDPFQLNAISSTRRIENDGSPEPQIVRVFVQPFLPPSSAGEGQKCTLCTSLVKMTIRFIQLWSRVNQFKSLCVFDILNYSIHNQLLVGGPLQ